MIQFWKPIANAPRDGTRILLLIGTRAIEGWWNETDGWQVVDLPSHGCGCCSYENPTPTHWAPLPNLEK